MIRLSDRQLILMGAMFVFDATLISVQAQMAFYAKQHLWLSQLIAFAILLIPLWCLSKLFSRFQDQDLFEALIGRFPAIGRIVSVFYVLFFFYLLSRDLRMTVDFCNVALLQDTPLGVTAGLIVISIIFLCYGGVEILGRSTELYGTLLLTALLLTPLLLLREFHSTNSMQFSDFNFPGILTGTWFVISYMGEVMGIAFLFSNRTMKFKHGFYALAIGTFYLTLLGVLDLLVLGEPILSRLMYPNYELVRQLRVTDFLDRFDLPMVGIWLPTMITKIGFSLYIVCLGIKRIVPKTSGQRFVAPVGLLAFACSFWFFSERDSAI